MTPVRQGTARRLGLHLPQHRPDRLYPRRWVLNMDIVHPDSTTPGVGRGAYLPSRLASFREGWTPRAWDNGWP
jgi:hypothetical protein